MSTSGIFYHDHVPVAVRVAQTVGITASAFLAGQAASASYLLTPCILESPAPLLARQWQKAFNINTAGTSVLALISSAIFGWLASREPTSSSAFKFYAIASTAIPLILPYKFILMKPVNDKLLGKADSLAAVEITDRATEAGVSREETAHALVDRWATLNLGNAILAFTGAIYGAWATLNPVEVISMGNIGSMTSANRT